MKRLIVEFVFDHNLPEQCTAFIEKDVWQTTTTILLSQIVELGNKIRNLCSSSRSFFSSKFISLWELLTQGWKNNVPYPLHIVLSLILSAISEMFLFPIFMWILVYNLYTAFLGFNTCELFNWDGDWSKLLNLFLYLSENLPFIACKHMCVSPYSKGLRKNFWVYFWKWTFIQIKYDKWYRKEANYSA